MWLIVGLGNPGRRYRWTRHNAGFMLLDHAADRWGGREFLERGSSMLLQGSWSDQEVLLLKPQTMMNRSGLAVLEALAYYAAEVPKLVVAYDDCHLPLGKLRLRERGSSGGHHGMESIIECLGSQEFMRLRLGIGDETLGVETARFVLQSFPKSAAAAVNDMIDRGVDLLESLMTAGASKTMSQFN